MRNGVLLISFVPLFLGCTTAKKFMVDGAPQLEPLNDWRTVRVFEHADSVPSAYVAVAEIEGEGDMLNSRKGVIDAMRREAAEVGANAIILQGYDAMGFGESLLAKRAYREARALAVYIESLPPEESGASST